MISWVAPSIVSNGRVNIISAAVMASAQKRPEVIIVPSAAEASSCLSAPSARAMTEAPPTPKVCDTAMMTSVAGNETNTEAMPSAPTPRPTKKASTTL